MKRLTVNEEIDADTGKLYGPISEAIKYLQEVQKQHPTATLDEKWTGYEDMYMRFVWTREENDKEYEDRMKVQQRVEANRLKEKQRVERNNQIKAEIKRLQAKLK